MNNSENEAHSAIYCSKNEYFARRCRHYKAKVWIAEWLPTRISWLICVVPSYGGTIENKYKTQKYYFEELNGVKIIRVRVPEFIKSNKMSRIKNILAWEFISRCSHFVLGI